MDRKFVKLQADLKVVAVKCGDVKVFGLLMNDVSSHHTSISVFIIVGADLRKIDFPRASTIVEYTNRKGFNGLMEMIIFGDTFLGATPNLPPDDLSKLLEFMDDVDLLNSLLTGHKVDGSDAEFVQKRLKELGDDAV
ncbi:MAG: hypothetical protein ABII13_03840 [Patescibacteria group bacterium]|nr:hypothetical protein [Patescibacteria group bacterium]MBU2509258.1 hypothetical protein [Patescibacteria group bacterium]